MWEAIASNRRRSVLLITILGLLLVSVGAAAGLYYFPQPEAPLVGAGAALVVWLVLWTTAMFTGDSILLAVAGARRIVKEEAPVLWNVVEEMTIAAGLPQMPAVYVIEDDAPNAFAVGYDPANAAVAVTSGLLSRMNRDELQGVVAHEIGHIHNLDVRFMTIASVMVGSITLVSEVCLRTLYYGGGRRRTSGREGGNAQAQLALFVLMLVLMLVAPVFAQLLYLACSRRREYLADACAAQFTRYPEGLASALEKLSHSSRSHMISGSGAIAPLLIHNPPKALSVAGIMETHPPIERRIAILRSMSGGADFRRYESAFEQVTGSRSHVIGGRTLQSSQAVPVREASVPVDAVVATALQVGGLPEDIARAREVGNLLASLGGYLFIPCSCGAKIKVPPSYVRETVPCMRCGKMHRIPRADPMPKPEVAAGDVAEAKSPVAPAPMGRYVRKTRGWESFRCACGSSVELSPMFAASRRACKVCGRIYEIDQTQAQG